MGKHSDVEALLNEEVRTLPAIIYRTDYITKLHERNSERKRMASVHVGCETGIWEGRLKSFFTLWCFSEVLINYLSKSNPP